MIAAFISATVALLIFTLTRWLEHRSSQTLILKRKLEDYYRSLEPIIQYAYYPELKAEDTLGDLRDAFTSSARKLAQSLSEPHMLASLYFPSTLPRFKRLSKCVGSYNSWMHDYADPELPYDADKGMQIFNDMNACLVDLKDYICSEQKTLTKSLGYKE